MSFLRLSTGRRGGSPAVSLDILWFGAWSAIGPSGVCLSCPGFFLTLSPRFFRPVTVRVAQWSGRKVFRERMRAVWGKLFAPRVSRGLARSGPPVIIAKARESGVINQPGSAVGTSVRSQSAWRNSHLRDLKWRIRHQQENLAKLADEIYDPLSLKAGHPGTAVHRLS